MKNRAMKDMETTTRGIPLGIASDLSQVIQPEDSAPTLPPGVYADAGVFSAEAEFIFQTGWIGIGRSDRWMHPGNYTALELAGIPTVVIRGEDGVLQAFSKTCSHRSSQILVGEGSCRHIRCPFHFWTYGLDGHLMGTPR
jgi:phenylpropionate dioxygenase-like ring-hydroxylating dioxygenase large terminal subunit